MKVAWRTSARRDPRHSRPALRQDLDEPLRLEAAERFRNGKARDAEALADLLLVEVGAWRQVGLDDGFPQRGEHAVGRAAAAGQAEGRKKFVGRGFRGSGRHSNMLVRPGALSKRARHYPGSFHDDHRPPPAPDPSPQRARQRRRRRRCHRRGHGVARRRRRRCSGYPKGHKVAVVPISEGQPIRQIRPDHRLRVRADRARQPCPHP